MRRERSTGSRRFTRQGRTGRYQKRAAATRARGTRARVSRPGGRVAKLPTIAAYAYKKSVGQPVVYPRNDLGYVEN
ncbi:hypothetical protein AB0943_31555, partial [Streptomyces sp. NPDC007044]|uniref:hypothetical protein n=1 Tax=Streptomyces sp. NPDC007044 TaxID=3156911 RepID=UPI00345266FB